MNENDNVTPWSWQQPPLPRNLLLLGSNETRHSDTWFRRFFGFETIFASSAASGLPGHIDPIMSCHLSVPVGDNYRRLDLHTVKRAVKALRFDHPTIASQWAWPNPNATSGEPLGSRDGRLAYQVPKGESEVEEWLSEVVINREADLHTCNFDLDQAIDLVRRDLGKAVTEPRAENMFQLHFLPSSGAGQKHGIVLRLGHVVFDGIAAFQAVNLLLSKIAETIDVKSDMAKGFAWGEEVKRLAKPFPDRSVIPWSAEKTDESLYMKKRLTDYQVLSKTAHGINMPNPTATPSTTGVIFKTVSSTRLSRLLRSVRKQQCTMWGVLLAISVISTLRTNPPKPGFEDITTPMSINPLNLRPYCRQEHEDVQNKSELGCVIATILLFAENLRRFVHDDSSLADKQRLMDDIFTLSREAKNQLEDQRSYMPTASVWLTDFFENLVSNPPPTAAIPMVSSVGIMDVNSPPTYSIPNRSDVDDAVRISELLCSVRNPYPPPNNNMPIFMSAYTWQGVLHLAFNYSEAHLGSIENLEARKHGFGESEGNVLDYVENYMNILDIMIDVSNDTDPAYLSRA